MSRKPFRNIAAAIGTSIVLFLVVILAIQVGAAGSQGPDASKDLDDGSDPGVANPLPLTDFEWAQATLYDNGPLVSCVGCGVGGADESVLQNVSLSMNTLGYGHQLPLGFWIADDFTVSDGGGWDVTSFTFFAYQTNSPITSTITDTNWMLYDGDPGSGGTMIAGAGGLDATIWSNIYRATETTTGQATNRPIMANQVNASLHIPAGTYWLAWQTDGTLASGPWAPPITVSGTLTTGNGYQSTDGGATWPAAIDSGSLTQQGFPFIIEGTVAAAVPDMIFDKTVGLDVNSCATSDEITVPAGGGGADVTYCYTMDNTGTTTLTYQTVDDDQLGTLLGPDAMIAVGPGQSYSFTETATITETTVNVATWYVTDGDGTDIISDTDTATVTQQAPTSVALSSIEFETTNWLIPVAFVAMLSVAGAAFVLRRKATA